MEYGSKALTTRLSKVNQDTMMQNGPVATVINREYTVARPGSNTDSGLTQHTVTQDQGDQELSLL